MICHKFITRSLNNITKNSVRFSISNRDAQKWSSAQNQLINGSMSKCERKTQFNRKIRFHFSNQINKPQQKTSASQKFFSYLNIFKDKQITGNDLQNLVLQITTATSLSAFQKSSASKLLMSILFKKNFPADQLLSNPSIKKLQQNQPFLKLQTIMYAIAKQKTKQQPNTQLINDLYFECFNDVLESAKGNQRMKCEAVLYKNFGKHMVESGVKDKGTLALENSVGRHKELILEEYHKIQKISLNSKQQGQQQKTEAEMQRQKLQINAIKQNIRRLMQSMFEILYFYYDEKRFEIKNLQLSTKQREQKIVEVCTLIKDCMKLKTIVPRMQLYSRYYHRLMQIYYQLEYAFALMKKNQEKAKEIRKLMKEFEKQCMYDIREAQQYLEVQKEIALAILSMQLHLSRTQKGRDINAIKLDLTQCGIKIMEAGKMEASSISREVITKLLGDFIKKNLSPETK